MSGIAALPRLLDALSTSMVASDIPTAKPSPVNCPISLVMREGDRTCNDLRKVDATLFAMFLAVAYILDADELSPELNPMPVS